MYRDEGTTFAYKQGKLTTTRIVCEDGKELRLTIDESNKLFTPRRYVARFHLHQTPLATGWDAGSRVLTVPLASGASTHHELV